jgi:hypothetical protein
MLGCQRLTHKVSPEKRIRKAHRIIKRGAVRKKRKGKSIGGSALKDKPLIFILCYLLLNHYSSAIRQILSGYFDEIHTRLYHLVSALHSGMKNQRYLVFHKEEKVVAYVLLTKSPAQLTLTNSLK